MGRRARRRRVLPARGTALGRGVAGTRRPLRLRLERLRLRGHERPAGGGRPQWPSSPRETRPTTGRETYGARKAACERIVVEAFGDARARRSAGPHRRPARPDRPLHVLAAPRRARRRGARARVARLRRAVHRRPRSRRVDRRGGGRRRRRHVQRDRRDDAARRPARASARASRGATHGSCGSPSDRAPRGGGRDVDGLPLWLARPAGRPACTGCP